MAEQHYVSSTGMVVDPARFKRNGETLLFSPFSVSDTRPLAEVLQAEELPPDESMLVAVRRDDLVIALSRRQMAYHHVAQGTTDGEPWLVFF